MLTSKAARLREPIVCPTPDGGAGSRRDFSPLTRRSRYARLTRGGPGPKAVRPSPGAGQFIQLALGPVPLVAVPSLQLPDELIPPAGGLVQVVVGQVAPLLLDLPLELLPIALDLVPVHNLPPGPTTGTAKMVISDDAPAV